MHSTFILHAAWLVQTSVHWPIFLTAASRRSLVRVSVPVWGENLSVPLCIIAMVSRYLTIQLIQRMPISNHRSFQLRQMPVGILWGIRPNFFGLSPCWRQVAYALRTRPPVAGRSTEALHPLPLDLHVLGLPLAFILSQDQTLHCKKCFVKYLGYTQRYFENYYRFFRNE